MEVAGDTVRYSVSRVDCKSKHLRFFLLMGVHINHQTWGNLCYLTFEVDDLGRIVTGDLSGTSGTFSEHGDLYLATFVTGDLRCMAGAIGSSCPEKTHVQNQPLFTGSHKGQRVCLLGYRPIDIIQVIRVHGSPPKWLHSAIRSGLSGRFPSESTHTVATTSVFGFLSAPHSIWVDSGQRKNQNKLAPKRRPSM